jgi:hypothetical protein
MWKTRGSVWAQINPFAHILTLKTAQIRCGTVGLAFFRRPYLDEEVLISSRSRKVCMTCHWFRHYAEVNRIPVLTCQLHQWLMSYDVHLPCRGWG